MTNNSSDFAERPAGSAVGQALAHESAREHVTGAALFTDDLLRRYPGVLHAWPVPAPHAHARVLDLDVSAALAVPGVVHVMTVDDVPGSNIWGVNGDEPLFPDEIMYFGQPVCWVLGETLEAARLGGDAVQVRYEPLPALLTIAQAVDAESFQGAQPRMVSGDVEAAFADSAHVFEGETEMGGQEHFYLETQASLADIDESGQIVVQSSTQHPSESQAVVASLLGLARHRVTVQSLRMGGGFGGKEVQPRTYSAVAALGTYITKRPVRVRLTRQQDLTMTGKRHPYHATWKVGFDPEGNFTALQATLTADGGWSQDLSGPVLTRALCHIDNAYHIPNVDVLGRVALTHKTSQTAFRGFGGPQGMLVIEDIISRCSPLMGLDANEVRRQNFYREGQATPYGQAVRHAERMPAIWDDLVARSDFTRRAGEVADFNAAHRHVKRGLAITPLKFGISFNFTPMNQAGALVHVYTDGSVLINHGGTEMGQGLHTKMIQVAAGALGVHYEQVRPAPTRTDKVPNTWPTAASCGSDLNGAAIRDACETIKARMAEVAASRLGAVPDDIRFRDGKVFVLGDPDTSMTFADLCGACCMERVSMSSTGFYRTDGLWWDGTGTRGVPFKYFAYGASVSEVEVDGFNGTYTLRRVDIVHDVGDSLSPAIDRGQIEGGFVQGAGWLTLEDLRWDTGDGDSAGRVSTQSASTYKLPSLGEMPAEFNVHLLPQATENGAIYGSKAVGEPPLMLAFSVREALRAAAAAFGPPDRPQLLASPATPEAVYWAIKAAREAADESSAAPVAATSTT